MADDTTFLQRHAGKGGAIVSVSSLAAMLGVLGWTQTHIVWKDDFKEQKARIDRLEEKINSLDKQLEVMRNLERKHYE